MKARNKKGGVPPSLQPAAPFSATPPRGAPATPAAYAPRNPWVFLAAAVLTFGANWGLDRITKDLAVTFLQGKEPTSFLGGLVVLRFSLNDGAFLGLGGDWPGLVKNLVLLGIPLLVCLGAVVWSVLKERSLVRAVLIVTVAAGGVGNLADRLFNGFQVVDFLNFGIGPLRTGILNVADLSVTFGLLALLVMGSRNPAAREGSAWAR